MSRIAAALTAAVFVCVLLAPVDTRAQVLLDCDYFNFQEQAQAILDDDPSDPYLLDEAGDGFACPDLPAAGPDPDFPEEPENGDFQCVDFPYQEMAQVIYDEDVTDPHNLDPTGDGIACSLLPLQADNQGDESADAGGNDQEARREARRAEREAEQEGGNQNQGGNNQGGDDQGGNNQGNNADEGAAQETAPEDDASASTDEEDREARRAARQAAREAEQNAGEENADE